MENQLATIDPAWFYTAIAQVTAAIVGLLGAVIGSRLIDQYNQMVTKKRKVNKRILHLKNRVNNQNQWLNSMTQYLDTIIAYNNQHGSLPTNLTYFATWGSNGGGGQQPVQGWANIADMQIDRNLIPAIRNEFTSLVGNVSLKDMDAWSKRIEGFASQVKGERGTEILGSYKGSITEVIKEISRFKEQVLPFSFWWMAVVFIWMCVTGIVWPLMKLRGFWDFHPQPLILGSVSIGLIAMAIIFGIQFWQVSNIKNFSWDIHEDDVDES